MDHRREKSRVRREIQQKRDRDGVDGLVLVSSPTANSNRPRYGASETRRWPDESSRLGKYFADVASLRLVGQKRWWLGVMAAKGLVVRERAFAEKNNRENNNSKDACCC